MVKAPNASISMCRAKATMVDIPEMDKDNLKPCSQALVGFEARHDMFIYCRDVGFDPF